MTADLLTRDGLDGYRAFLIERDGDADLLNRSLARRDDFFHSIEHEVVRSSLAVDRATFFENLHRRQPEDGLSPQIYWLLATAKLNQAERFGVGLGETYGLNSGEDAPVERVYLELEEHYHSRLLGYVLDMFDLPFQVVPPSPLMRQLVKTAVFVPRWFSAPFVGAAEMAGCVMFALLGARGVELFADEPAVAARIRLLYNEILTDEIGHVGYCAANCTTRGRRAMRRLYPLIGRYVIHGTPELAKTLGRDEITSHLDAPFDLDAYATQVDVQPFIAQRP